MSEDKDSGGVVALRLARLLDALDAIERVRALHSPRAESPWSGACGECTESWPCPTIRALDGPLSGGTA